ncbi:MAG: GntR family transcriptional regulator [Sulfurovum sp.]|nr:GntR family transcriptional regulator [Sulfurovum sp.]MCB4752176.1 GntR family transcriptional regulator [Sulfurovum sp.]MCB4760328.1 GntR family transcriptional regulator [Sulfurovum sp.]MCB4762063.1 GntR family transcriptional regulator [Sulfurovum sp.]MCB4779122.1 GntR family transcriptional regulator [Sulfurovum sp.]
MIDIQKVPLKEKIASVLMQRIIDGDIVAGQKLKESHLAKEFGVSQAPVREAMILLTAQGILEYIPNVGTRVKSYSKEETIEIYEVREALELYAAQTIEKFGQLSNLKQMYHKMLEVAKKKDIHQFVEYDQFFHELLVQNRDNNLVVKLWREQYTKSSVQNIVKGFESTLEDIVKMHQPIIEAIEKKSTDAYIKAIHHHYEVIIANIKEDT